MTKPVLEAVAQETADARVKPPFLYQLGLECARKALDDLQQPAPVEKPDVEEKWITVSAVPVSGSPGVSRRSARAPALESATLRSRAPNADPSPCKN